MEKHLVVDVERDGPERRRCGARPATHHRMCGGAIVEMLLSELARSVVGTFRISARRRLETDADPPGPERVDIVGPVGPLLGGRFRVRRGVGAGIGGG